jgi:hypothetical protein
MAIVKLILAIALSSVIAHMCTSALPFLIGSLAISMIFFSPLMRRLHPLPLQP